MAIGGVQQQFWAKSESTSFDTVSAFAATDALDMIELTFEPEKNFEELVTHQGSGSLITEVAGMEGGKWSGSVYVKPAAAGTAPDYGEILKAAFGTETVSGGTSVTYSFSDGNVLGTSIHSLQLGKYSGDDLYEVVNGAWVEQVTFEVVGNQAPKITFSGGFSSYGYVYGSATVSGAHSGTDTVITLASGVARQIGVNALVEFDSEDNGGSGYTVTAIDLDNDQITITPGLAGGLSGGEVVNPLVPSQTLGGTVIGGVQSGCTIDSTSIGFVSLNLSVNTGIKGLDKEATSSKPARIFRSEVRKVEGELSVYFLDESTKYIGAAWDGTLRDILVRAGADTAAARQKINLDNCRIGVTSVPMSDTEATVVAMPLKARQNAAAGDEMDLVYD